MERNSFSKLPTTGELQGILSAEMKRDIPAGKEDKHYFDFAHLAFLAGHLGIDASLLTAEYSLEDVAREDLLARGKEFIEELKKKLLGRELSLDDEKALDRVYDYLSEEDAPERADLIFVFGAKTPLRIEKAVELYKGGMASKVLVSGRGPHYREDDRQTEASMYAEIAMNMRVPEEAIIKEERSITIPDNVRGSLNLLDERGTPYNTIILVNSPYTQRRGFAHFKKYTDDSVNILRVNAKTGEWYQRDTWYKNPGGVDVIAGEFVKAKVAVSLNTA